MPLKKLVALVLASPFLIVINVVLYLVWPFVWALIQLTPFPTPFWPPYSDPLWPPFIISKKR